MIEGADINHDIVAARCGIGRRTIYRYFPQREPLLEAAWKRVLTAAENRLRIPHSRDQYFAELSATHSSFDEVAELMTLFFSTPRGRATRLSHGASVREAFHRAFERDVAHLPGAERALPLAVLQLIHSAAWLEMRDFWGLDAEQISRASSWAANVLVRDLHRRASLPLGLGLISED